MRIWCVLVLILVCLPLVYSGEGRTFEIDFNNHDRYDLWLKKSDRVLFEYGRYNHTIIVDEIKDKNVELDLFFFLERWLHTPEYMFLDKKYNLRLDFDKDGKKELEVVLGSISEDKERVNLVFNRLEAWDKSRVLKFEDANKTEEKNLFNKYIYVGVGAIFLILVFILINYIKKRKENYF